MASGVREPEETSAKTAATVRTILPIRPPSSWPTKTSQCYIAVLKMQTIGQHNGTAIAEICSELASARKRSGCGFERERWVVHWNSLLSRPKARAQKTPNGFRIYAIGDIHGRVKLN